MKILVVGTGAREHVICQVVSQNAELYSYMSNQNPGIAKLAEKFYIGNEMELEEVKKQAISWGVDLAIIGPESPLGEGIVDLLLEEGIACVGPTQAAARIETDKAFMRKLFIDHGIDGSVTYGVFDDVEEAGHFIDDFGKELVVKPVGLTGGKGVKIVGEHLKDDEDAKKYVKEIINNKISGYASVVLEERLVGEEYTIQALVDGNRVIPMPAAQDHPHAYEGDQGPITGGMGSYSDTNGLLPFLDEKAYQDSVKIMEDTIKAVRKEVGPYKGILYGQFMLCRDGPRLVEYNARFGDPEAMNVLPLLKTSFVELCQQVVDGNLKKASFEPKATVCKYLVPNGYPESGRANSIIRVDEEKINEAGAGVYYAAVNQKNNQIFTSSSRALALVAAGESISEAEEICEKATSFVDGDLYHRRDVGTTALIQKRIKHMEDLLGT
ncbi:MAG TPA: phosphoribosylamine--glycine ligase [Methanobacteriaceae archaeon]|nr:phosphoribosylamine--glycine ligase [Methanobacteriaceae archaeon]HNS24565.1 phosphoribosylamine--glycine ligase [Methanobacteriaceae archaeon]